MSVERGIPHPSYPPGCIPGSRDPAFPVAGGQPDGRRQWATAESPPRSADRVDSAAHRVRSHRCSPARARQLQSGRLTTYHTRGGTGAGGRQHPEE